MKPLPPNILDDMAYEMSMAFAEIATRYKELNNNFVTMLTDLLASFVAIHSDKPAEALAAIAKRIAATDHAQIRLRHFGHTLEEVKNDGIEVGASARHVKPG